MILGEVMGFLDPRDRNLIWELFPKVDHSFVYYVSDDDIRRPTQRRLSSIFLCRVIGARDNGVCEYCNLRCNDLYRLLGRTFIFGDYRRSKMASDLSDRFRWAFYKENGCYFLRKRLWEADHRIPLSLGGSDHLSNIRTLCIPCHRAATKHLMAHLSKVRRGVVDGGIL